VKNVFNKVPLKAEVILRLLKRVLRGTIKDIGLFLQSYGLEFRPKVSAPNSCTFYCDKFNYLATFYTNRIALNHGDGPLSYHIGQDHELNPESREIELANYEQFFTNLKLYLESPEFKASEALKPLAPRTCYTFNGVTVCRFKKPKAFEAQYKSMCAKHSLNNFFLNQTVDPSISPVTNEEIFKVCADLSSKKSKEYLDQNPYCVDGEGWFHNQVLMEVSFIKLQQSTIDYTTTLNINNIFKLDRPDATIIGSIILYQAEHCARHYVTVLNDASENRYLVLDSNDEHKEYRVLDTEEEIKKYFERFIWALVFYTRA